MRGPDGEHGVMVPVAVFRTVRMEMRVFNAVVRMLVKMDVTMAKELDHRPDPERNKNDSHDGLGEGLDNCGDNELESHRCETEGEQGCRVAEAPEEPELHRRFFFGVVCNECGDGSDMIDVEAVQAAEEKAGAQCHEEIHSVSPGGLEFAFEE